MLKLIKQAVVDFFSDNAPRHGAAIAYYTLFALAPVLLLVIAVAGFAVGEDVVRSELLTQIAGLIGRDGAVAVGAMLERAGKRDAGVFATVLGIGGLVFAATGAFLELQAALNMIWRVRATASSGIDVPQIVTRRLRSLGVVVSIGFLLLVSLSVSAAIKLAIAWMSRLAPGLEAFVAVVDQLISLAVTSALFGLLFRVLPDVHLRWRDVAVGSTVTAVLFAIGQRLIGLYLGNSALASPFGAAGTVVILLVWVYYSAQILLFGAEFTRLYAERAGKRAPLMDGAVRTTAP
ncbi:YihY/virulence factor BrkB family protein [Gemmatimonas sp.]|uniref:YihY/virulence factor BrkB family protein n=1 Tax=Gemmatimonas sp. TaxID=1962908 RepID=UPI00286BBA56|nr:YihY/virulence factor BrkB family protein [Gemmatimonas sp.]